MSVYQAKRIGSWMLFAACMFSPLASQAQVKWDFFIFVPTSHPIGKYAVEFAELVRKQTNGELVITVRPPGELPYKATEVVRVVADGNVQLGDGISGWVGGESPVGGFVGMPYLLETADDLEKVWPKIEPIIQSDLKRWGVRVLYHYYYPAQQFWGSAAPIKNLNDIKGRKIRVTSPELGYFVKQLGAESVSFTTAEIPMAIQRQMMDSLTTSMLNLVGSRWDEFMKWGYIANTSVLACYILVNQAAYDKLSKEHKAAVDSSARTIETKLLAAIPKLEASYRDKLKVQGVQLIEQTPADRKRATEIMIPYWKEQAEKGGASTQNALKVMRQTLGK